MQVSWTIIKDFCQTRNISIQYLDLGDSYELKAFDGLFTLECSIPRSDTADTADFEATLKPSGNASFRSGHYATYVSVRQTAATGANGTVWAMRNPVGSGKTMYVERINLQMSFDAGTPLGRSLLRYFIVGFMSATPSGGTTQTAAKLDSTNAASIGPDIRSLDTGLTTTSVNFGNAITVIGCPASDGATTSYTKNHADYIAKLAPGEGICIRLAVAAVIGQGLTGEIVWSER